MKRLLAVAASAALAIGGLALAAPTASADDRTCRGSIGSGYVDGNVIVPSGASCNLNGTRIDGNVEVGSNATLSANNVTVDGNIQSQGHRSVAVSNSRVNGNIQLEQGGAITLSGNRVDGDIQLFSNRSGAKVLDNNRAEGNIQCKSNTPAPTGTGNTADGNLEDQCRNLRPAGGGGSTGPGTGQNGANVDIYVTEGRWSKNGREWRTVCAPYSQSERCTTEIWATQVTRDGGRYVNKSGWYFNNLTYKPMPRSMYANNPLGKNGSWTSEGRQWRTECDTALTGQGGCRTFVTADVIERRGGTYRTVTREVFNNMVRFS
ncbi:hypothetical protein GCM10028820_32610 [Tessaracoccus terricola]